ncbi:lipase family protein (macronuclear) [Tetrahymena thermophila SB210]|uniref:Lipase family protein n=1 Tax=Tetrahymena thermophila (strain SB210) TaxID=312017 RepID=Q23T89_TETTS|nr:lipase family protein [Tetrahymena thermophila SB210]EAR99817.1 lipase family protein [Tetrahymena thermophila SB210]|eukprot:XP_001020062.1 lipase family protein [Tetrahymena thermophila SB210]
MIKVLSLVLIVNFICIACSQKFEYDEEMAKNLLGFSLLAYCKPENIPKNNCGEPCQRNPSSLIDYLVMTSNSTHTSGIIGYSTDHDAIIITFRGTISTDLTNWMYNLDSIKAPFTECTVSNCKVHQGFLDHFNNIKDQLTQHFKELKQKYPQAKIFLTGHSLGAAIATISLAHIYSLNEQQQIDIFYNFGSPRVGNVEFVNWFTQQNMAKLYGRITTAQDPVIHTPPSNFPFYFQHINQEIYYLVSQKNATYIQCEKPNDSNCIRSSIEYSIQDHLNYFGWNLKQSKKPCK